MSDVVVFIGLLGAAIKKSQRELVSLARTIGNPVVVVVEATAGASESLAAEFGKYGATRVVAAHAEAFAQYPVESQTAFLQQVVEEIPPATEISAVISDNSGLHTDILARLSVRWETGVLTDVVALDPQLTATQAVFSGQYVVKSTVASGALPLFTVRPNSVVPVEDPQAAEWSAFELKFEPPSAVARVTERTEAAISERPDIEEASAVVCAGRGIDGDLTLVEELADELGAGLGATRAVVDNDWIDHSAQIGQTGKTVAPRLYLGVGVSGALQHRSGIQGADHIVAINKDPEATIFEFADWGVVGDLNEVVPQIIAEIKQRKA